MERKPLFKRLEPLFFVLLALIFTIGLMFASAELPKALDRLLGNNVHFLDVATGQNELSEYKTELFLSHYHIRLIGYICLGLIIVLIILGFVLEKRGLASTGAILLFLPVFGHFAATMFFLGGLAFLRFLWLPFLDISFDIMRLGDIIVLPYKWILDGAAFLGLNIYKELPFILTGLGIFIFLTGVLTWITGRVRKQNVTDFWIYRLSRHPQYLGWIIWSYGVLFLPGSNMRRYVDVANTLPWLLATMVIVGVALLEERSMRIKFGEDYRKFQERTSFMFPLSRFLRRIFSLPFKLIFKKDYPERKREIALVLFVATLICIVLSGFYSGLFSSSRQKASTEEMDRWVHIIKTSQHRGEIRESAASLASSGEAGVDSLIDLLHHDNMFVRWYCAGALGRIQSDKIVQPLAELLDDPDHNVRRTAAGALGSVGSPKAIPILIDVFQDTTKGVEHQAARSLGNLKATEAVPILISGLESDNKAILRGCTWALGEIGAKEAVQPLIALIQSGKDIEYNLIGDALRKLGSEHAADAYIAGLESDTWWIQGGCATSLGELKSEKAFAQLANALKNGDARLKRDAVLAIAKYPFEQSEPVLQEALEDEDWEVRMYARAALQEFQAENK